MILWPRGIGKTTSSRVEQTQLVLNYPNIRICFLTGGDILARRQLAALKAQFEKPTPEFLRLFPEFCLVSKQNKKSGEWKDYPAELGNSQQFTVPCRTNHVFAEPTFVISTARTVKAGSHFNVIFIDDLVNDQNYKSAPALEKVYQNYLDICPLLEPTGYIIMTGTRYSYGDTYERIQEVSKEMGESSIWQFSIRDCWATGCKNCNCAEVFHDRRVNVLQPPCTTKDCSCIGFASDGTRGVLFPQVTTKDGNPFGHTLDILNKLRAELGESFFANQYENKPIADAMQTFTETMLGAQTLHDKAQLPGSLASDTFIMGDIAYSADNEDRDETVLFVFHKFQGQLFFVDCVFGHMGSHALVDAILKITLKWRPKSVFLEKNLGSDSLNDQILARAAEHGLPKVPLMWIPQSNVKGAKNARIAQIQASLMGKRVWFYVNMPGYQKLVNQLCKWPRGKHDDFADTLAMAIEAPTGWTTDTLPPPPSTTNWLRRLNAVQPVDDSYGDNGCGTGLVC
jgi:predicted phage terminase large subunit-like protein